MSAALVEARVRLPLRAFELRVDLTLRARATGIFGPSGSGKTSLVESLLGLRPRAEGRVRFRGETWQGEGARAVPPERRRVGYVPQDGLLFPHLDVRGNLLAGARRLAAARRREILGEVIDALELDPLLSREVGALSGGERQRVAVGRALCTDPRLLVLDEPLTGLDLPLQRRILAFLARVPDRLDVPLVLVSHDPLAIQALCEDLVVLRAGSVIAQGPPRAVLADPAVFPLAAEGGFRNVIPCRVESVEGATCHVRLGALREGPVLVATGTRVAAGDTTLVSIPASDILVAVEPPRGISARNVIGGKVTAVTEAAGLRLVHVLLADGVPELLAEVTQDACDELRLAPGRDVHLVVKTAACQVW